MHDRMYCLKCKKSFPDIRDVGRRPKFIINCPRCMTMHVINLTVLKEKKKTEIYIPILRHSNKTILEKIQKQLIKLNIINESRIVKTKNGFTINERIRIGRLIKKEMKLGIDKNI